MNILVTGAGGPAATSFIQALDESIGTVFMADMDNHAAGLYLVPAKQRLILLPGDDPHFVINLLEQCLEHEIDIVVPTVDVELLAIAKARATFEKAGVQILLASEATLVVCLDKLKSLIACQDFVPVPRFTVFNEHFNPSDWQFPVIVKPRAGSGSRGIIKVDSAAELAKLKRSETLIIQEFLPGEEFSVDVFADQNGDVLAAVPRERMKVDSGIAVVSRTMRNAELETFARIVAERVGLTFTANIQFRRNINGLPCLLEINPRFPGTMPLTVASGVNMPRLSLKALLDLPIAESEVRWKELAMVRTWRETYLNASEIYALAKPSYQAMALAA